MKKKNLLTLGALCLSLGLVVSSCNQAGTEGPTGPTGPTGPQGEPGVPGTNGKTYKDVIVVNDDDIKGGTVTQDVYFVTEGAHDSVTFTFTPENESDNVVINFEINGKVVEDLDPTLGSYTLEDADTIEGSIQVTGIEFTTVDKYGQGLLDSAVEDILESDKSLDLVKSDGKTTFLDHEKEEYIETEYSADATASVQDVYDAATETVAKAVADAKKASKDDVKAQLTAIETAATSEVTKIQEAYAKAVSDAKVVAKDDLTDLSDEVDSEGYSDTDKTAQVDSFEAKIDAATTIQGLGKIINGGTPAGTGEEGDAEANTFFNLKKEAFEEVQEALNSVEENSEELEDETLVGQLKEYGVDTTKLPDAVAEEHFKIISAAAEISALEDDPDGYKTDLGKTGAEAVKGSITGIKETILAAVKEKYHKEINESKALAGLDSTKTALLGVVDNAISNFETADKDLTTMSIAQYVSANVTVKDGETSTSTTSDVASDGSITTKGLEDLGLIGYIEYMLANPVNTAVNTAFLNERIATAKTSALATLKAAKDAITDETYLALTSYTKITSGTTTKYYVSSDKVSTSGSVSKEIHNPFFTGTAGTEKDTTTNLYEVENFAFVKPDKTLIPSVSSLLADGAKVDGEATYNLNDWYNTLASVDMTKVKGDGTTYGTLYIQNWATQHLTDFKKIYTAGLTELKDALNGKAGSVELTKENYATQITNNNVKDTTGVYGAIQRSGLKGAFVAPTIEGGSWNKNEGTGANEYDYVDADKLATQWDNLNKNLDSNTEDSKISSASELVSVADGIEDNIDSVVALNKGFVEWYAGKYDSTAEEPNSKWSGGIIQKDSGFENYFEPKTGTSVSSLKKALDNEITSVLKGDVSLSSATAFVRPTNLNKLYEADVDAYREAAVALLEGVYNGQLAQTVDPVGQTKLSTTYKTWSGYLGHALKLDTTTNTWVIDDKKGDIKDYLGETIFSVDTWFDHASDAIKDVKFNDQTEKLSLKIWNITTNSSDLNKELETAMSNGNINIPYSGKEYTQFSSLSNLISKLGNKLVITGSFGLNVEEDDSNAPATLTASITKAVCKVGDSNSSIDTVTSLVSVGVNGSEIEISVDLSSFKTNLSGKWISVELTINHPHFGEVTRTIKVQLPTLA